MLDRFGFEPPVAISNVRTQVRDLDYDTPPALNASVTMDRAWRIMLEQSISVVPVTTDDGKLHGMLSAGDIASYDMRSITDNHVENLPLFNLLSVLEGRVQGEGDPVDTVSGTVSIAVPQSIETLLFEGQDPPRAGTAGLVPDSLPDGRTPRMAGARGPHLRDLHAV